METGLEVGLVLLVVFVEESTNLVPLGAKVKTSKLKVSNTSSKMEIKARDLELLGFGFIFGRE